MDQKRQASPNKPFLKRHAATLQFLFFVYFFYFVTPGRKTYGYRGERKGSFKGTNTNKDQTAAKKHSTQPRRKTRRGRSRPTEAALV